MAIRADVRAKRPPPAGAIGSASDRGCAASPPKPRPGLPLGLTLGPIAAPARQPSSFEMEDAAAAAKAAREARRSLAQREEAPGPPAQEGGRGEGAGAGEAAPEAAGEAGARGTPAPADGGEGEARREGGGRARVLPAGGTPIRGGSGAPGGAFPPAQAPPLPATPLPDLNGIRTPIVPPPPAPALARRDKIIQATGTPPEGHHAAVQQELNRLADGARSAQRQVVFEVGGIAARTRHSIEELAARIPGIVGAAVATVRAAALAAKAAVRAHGERQAARIAAHSLEAERTMRADERQTALDMHKMLITEAPGVLEQAKAEVDRELTDAAKAAGQDMRAIPAGVEPPPMDPGVAPAAEAIEPTEDAGAEGGGEQHTTWGAAELALSGELRADNPGSRTAQYGNLQCDAALPDLVPPLEQAYRRDNKETISQLTSDENKARFFDHTLGLIVPTIDQERLKETDEGDPSRFQGHLAQNLGKQYMDLGSAKQQAIRQLDLKLAHLERVQLNPDLMDRRDSLPYQHIHGLRDAGRQIQKGLMDQARTVEASLKGNLAELAAAYPDLVARLRPLVDSGEFLEATATLAQLAEAAASVDELQAGQLRAVADQAAQALARARKGFDKQVASLHDSARKGVASIQQTTAIVQYDFVKTALQYTGVIDEGVREALPAIHAHASQLAERLLGPKMEAGQSFSNIKTRAIRYMNNVMAGEWQGYLARVNSLPDNLGGVQTSADDGLGENEFGRIRKGVREDLVSRQGEIFQALDPPRPPTGALVVGYVLSPLAAAAVHYYTDPDESRVVTQLSVPWPGPNAIGESFEARQNGRDMIAFIEQRMEGEEELDSIRDLFSTNVATRSDAKIALLNASPNWSGISEEAAMALSQSFTRDEVSAEVMSEEERRQLGDNLRRTLSRPNMEIAAAYINGEPDLALAIRMRQLFDRQRGKTRDQQLQTGQQMQGLIQAELFASGSAGYVPQETLDRMRDAAFRRFPETIDANNRPVRPSINDSGPADRAARVREARAAADHPDAQARADPDLEAARRRIVAYMNRPSYARTLRRGDERLAASVERRNALDYATTTYDPQTGRYTVGPAQAIQSYNQALITYGESSPQARAARAIAVYSRASRTRGSLSTNEATQLNETFSDQEFAAMRRAYLEATPRERQAMQRQMDEAEARHRQFLQLVARGMGYEGDDPAQAGDHVARQLGGLFAAEGERFREAGRQIVQRGRMDIETGVDLAATGLGTNEDLMQAILANRSQRELNARSRMGRGKVREYATRVASSELSGDDWMQAQRSLLGNAENDAQRAQLAELTARQQREEGTGFIARRSMQGRWETRYLDESRAAVDQRMHDAMMAGVEEARRRGADIPPEDVPETLRDARGNFHPFVERYAMDADGRLRGEGPPMSVLAADVNSAARLYQKEIDRQESLLTSAITALAIVISVVLLVIPGVNLVAAGILTALITGAATVAVKAGMRGGRYGWEEMAVDAASAAVEMATAGLGGALSKGARAATLAGSAARAGAQAQRLGRVARVGAGLHSRLGPRLGPVAQEAMTGAISGSARTAMDDKVWDDGLGQGIARVTGQGLKGAAASGVNAAVSGSLKRRLEGSLAPQVANPANARRLNQLGRALGPGGREMVTDIVSGLGGSLSAEGLNILVDLALDKHKDGWKGAVQRLGRAGLQELASTAGKTGVSQMHRARYNRLSLDIHAERRDPTPAEARLLNRIGQSAGMVEQGTSTADFAARFSRVRARLADMPPALRDALRQMDPDNASQLIAMMDSGQLGTRKQRLAFVNGLTKSVAGLDVGAFDRLLLRANQDHAPARRQRKKDIAAARDRILSQVSGPERPALARLPVDDLLGLPPDVQTKLAAALAAGDGDFRRLAADLIPDDAGLRRRVVAELEAASRALTGARAAAKVARAKERDDLFEIADPTTRGAVAGLGARDAQLLHRHLMAGDAPSLARAAGILRKAGLAPEAAVAQAKVMCGRIRAVAARPGHLDNVPEAHRQAMANLPDDALIEIRVAQFKRKPLSQRRVDEIVVAARHARPGVDEAALRAAIGATMGSRRGRPGFREALAQKRALLDLVPFGMRRAVLKTPVLTLPDAAFFSFVRGKGSENAVTLIVDGEPVILLRQTADRSALGEEGVHVLQHADPRWREKMEGLGEQRMARWDALPLEAQVRAYRDKVDIEIDAQRRMVARLETRARRALTPNARVRAALQLDMAEASLAALVRRRGEVQALDAGGITRILTGADAKPRWLDQPSRMFNKGPSDEDIFRRVMPSAEEGLKSALTALTSRMSETDKAEVAAAVRRLRGTMPPAELAEMVRGLIPSQRRPMPTAHAVVHDLDAHLLLRRGGTGEARAVRMRVVGRFAGPDFTPADRRLARLVLDELVRIDPAEPPDLARAKRALLLGLDARGRRSMPEVLIRIRAAREVLGLTGSTGDLPVIASDPALQALALEGLAKSRNMVTGRRLAKPGQFVAYLKAMEATVRGVPSTLGSLSPQARRALVGFYVTAYDSGAPASRLRAVAEFAGSIVVLNRARSLPDERVDLARLVELLAVTPPNAWLRTMGQMQRIVLGRIGTTAATGDRITYAHLDAYLRRAIADPAFRASLMEIGVVSRPPASASPRQRERIQRAEDERTTALVTATTLASPARRFERQFTRELEHHRVIDVPAKEAFAAALHRRTVGLPEDRRFSLAEARAIAEQLDVLQDLQFFPRQGMKSDMPDLIAAFFERGLRLDDFGPAVTDAQRRRRAGDMMRAFLDFVGHYEVQRGRFIEAPEEIIDARSRALLEDFDLRIAGTGAIRGIEVRRTEIGGLHIRVIGEILPGRLTRNVNAQGPGISQPPSFNSPLREIYGTIASLKLDQVVQRLHLFGPGFGGEAAAAIWLGPERVNQELQARGIEDTIIALARRQRAQGGQMLVRLEATSWPMPPHGTGPVSTGESFLQSVSYHFLLMDSDNKFETGLKLEIRIPHPETWPKNGDVPLDPIELRELSARDLVDYGAY